MWCMFILVVYWNDVSVCIEILLVDLVIIYYDLWCQLVCVVYNGVIVYVVVLSFIIVIDMYEVAEGTLVLVVERLVYVDFEIGDVVISVKVELIIDLVLV